MAGGVAGFLAGWVSYRRTQRGISKSLLEDHARWLVPDETVLLLQAPVQTLHHAVSLLREGGDIPPIIFILHPKRAVPSAGVQPVRAQFLPAQIREHAERLGREHQVEPPPRSRPRLFKRLLRAQRDIHTVCLDLAQAGRLEQGTSPTAEWILDNEYVIESNARDVQVNLPVLFMRQLPSLKGGRADGLPRIYDIACALVSDLELRLDRENILSFIDSYQSASSLSIGELWALPQMLRIALIESVRTLARHASSELRERETADFWANRLIRANRRGPDHLFAILAELAIRQPLPSQYFAGQLIDHLYDEEAALVLVQGWLERTYRKPLREISLREQNRQANEQVSIGNAFTSLRQLALLDWREIFEQSSGVERLLRTDPAGVYPGMDFDTRDRYRRVIEEFARRAGVPETEVAQSVLALAAEAQGGPEADERRRHVGTWLIGEGRQALAQHLQCGESRRYRRLAWIYGHSAALYLPPLVILTLLSSLAIALAGLKGNGLQALVMTVLLLLPASQLVLELLNYLVTRFLPPRVLPKMDFKVSGVPDEFRTLVVVPLLLGNEDSIRGEAEKLEVRYMGNKERNILFSLFTDYSDADQAHREDDARLLQAAVQSIEALNRSHGEGRFLLFHRERLWSESEQKFIGWERKRGKLEELNGLIAGSRPEQSPSLVRVGDSSALRNVRFVITLDSDTQLPPGPPGG